MGKVYRARDTRLDRAVAIKVTGVQFSARFEREARAISALNHPHICTLYDVGPNYLVMELVEGQTLASHLKKGPLPMERVRRYGAQIAGALAAAHARGIVHRDLKPANIMIAEAGVKVLDFGVAKLASRAEAGAEQPLTGRGAVLGTPAYMAPEQLEGKECDARADIFALGLVLYEMATGKRAFAAGSQAALIAEMLRCEPPPLEQVPPKLAHVVRRCLAKEPERRWHSASDVKLELEDAEAGGDYEPGRARRRAPRISASRAGGLALLIAAAIAGTWFLARPKPRSIPPTFTQLTDQPGAELYPSLSPDGKSFAYQARPAGKWDIYYQRVGGKNAVNLTKDATEDNTQPTFSPDGESIAFRSEREGGGIFVMGATGENVKRLTDFGYNPTWSPDGREIVCTTGGFEAPEYLFRGSQLSIVNVATGAKRVIGKLKSVFQPQWSPHGHRIAYWALRDEHEQLDIWTVSPAGGEPVEVTNDAATDWNPVWSPDGQYLYFSSDRGGSRNLWRVRIDEETGKIRGSFQPVTTPSPFSWLISFSRDGGRMAYVQQTRTSNIYKIRFDPSHESAVGQPVPVTRGSREARLVDVSPDGQWVAFSSLGKQDNIYVVRVDGANLHQVTDGPYNDRMPRWSPDGKQIAFFSNRSGKFAIWIIKLDGSGLRQLTEDRVAVIGPVWAPDGSRLVVLRDSPQENFVMDATRAWAEQTTLSLPSLDQVGAQFRPSSWSPDGRHLAGYRVVHGSFAGIVIYSFDTQSYQQLTEFGHVPRWLSDSRRLLFNHRGKLYLLDSHTKKSHEVLSVVPNEINPWHFGLSRDDRLIAFSMAITEADVWLMTLGDSGH
jgi:Tol biopolymer transport system component